MDDLPIIDDMDETQSLQSPTPQLLCCNNYYDPIRIHILNPTIPDDSLRSKIFNVINNNIIPKLSQPNQSNKLPGNLIVPGFFNPFNESNDPILDDELPMSPSTIILNSNCMDEPNPTHEDDPLIKLRNYLTIVRHVKEEQLSQSKLRSMESTLVKLSLESQKSALAGEEIKNFDAKLRFQREEKKLEMRNTILEAVRSANEKRFEKVKSISEKPINVPSIPNIAAQKQEREDKSKIETEEQNANIPLNKQVEKDSSVKKAFSPIIVDSVMKQTAQLKKWVISQMEKKWKIAREKKMKEEEQERNRKKMVEMKEQEKLEKIREKERKLKDKRDAQKKATEERRIIRLQQFEEKRRLAENEKKKLKEEKEKEVAKKMEEKEKQKDKRKRIRMRRSMSKEDWNAFVKKERDDIVAKRKEDRRLEWEARRKQRNEARIQQRQQEKEERKRLYIEEKKKNWLDARAKRLEEKKAEKEKRREERKEMMRKRILQEKKDNKKRALVLREEKKRQIHREAFLAILQARPSLKKVLRRSKADKEAGKCESNKDVLIAKRKVRRENRSKFKRLIKRILRLHAKKRKSFLIAKNKLRIRNKRRQQLVCAQKRLLKIVFRQLMERIKAKIEKSKKRQADLNELLNSHKKISSIPFSPLVSSEISVIDSAMARQEETINRYVRELCSARRFYNNKIEHFDSRIKLLEKATEPITSVKIDSSVALRKPRRRNEKKREIKRRKREKKKRIEKMARSAARKVMNDTTLEASNQCASKETLVVGGESDNQNNIEGKSLRLKRMKERDHDDYKKKKKKRSIKHKKKKTDSATNEASNIVLLDNTEKFKRKKVEKERKRNKIRKTNNAVDPNKKVDKVLLKERLKQKKMRKKKQKKIQKLKRDKKKEKKKAQRQILNNAKFLNLKSLYQSKYDKLKEESILKFSMNPAEKYSPAYTLLRSLLSERKSLTKFHFAKENYFRLVKEMKSFRLKTQEEDNLEKMEKFRKKIKSQIAFAKSQQLTSDNSEIRLQMMHRLINLKSEYKKIQIWRWRHCKEYRKHTTIRNIAKSFEKHYGNYLFKPKIDSLNKHSNAVHNKSRIIQRRINIVKKTGKYISPPQRLHDGKYATPSIVKLSPEMKNKLLESLEKRLSSASTENHVCHRQTIDSNRFRNSAKLQINLNAALKCGGKKHLAQSLVRLQRDGLEKIKIMYALRDLRRRYLHAHQKRRLSARAANCQLSLLLHAGRRLMSNPDCQRDRTLLVNSLKNFAISVQNLSARANLITYLLSPNSPAKSIFDAVRKASLMARLCGSDCLTLHDIESVSSVAANHMRDISKLLEEVAAHSDTTSQSLQNHVQCLHATLHDLLVDAAVGLRRGPDTTSSISSNPFIAMEFLEEKILQNSAFVDGLDSTPFIPFETLETNQNRSAAAQLPAEGETLLADQPKSEPVSANNSYHGTFLISDLINSLPSKEAQQLEAHVHQRFQKIITNASNRLFKRSTRKLRKWIPEDLLQETEIAPLNHVRSFETPFRLIPPPACMIGDVSDVAVVSPSVVGNQRKAKRLRYSKRKLTKKLMKSRARFFNVIKMAPVRIRRFLSLADHSFSLLRQRAISYETAEVLRKNACKLLSSVSQIKESLQLHETSLKGGLFALQSLISSARIQIPQLSPYYEQRLPNLLANAAKHALAVSQLSCLRQLASASKQFAVQRRLPRAKFWRSIPGLGRELLISRPCLPVEELKSLQTIVQDASKRATINHMLRNGADLSAVAAFALLGRRPPPLVKWAKRVLYRRQVEKKALCESKDPANFPHQRLLTASFDKWSEPIMHKLRKLLHDAIGYRLVNDYISRSHPNIEKPSYVREDMQKFATRELIRSAAQSFLDHHAPLISAALHITQRYETLRVRMIRKMHIMQQIKRDRKAELSSKRILRRRNKMKNLKNSKKNVQNVRKSSNVLLKSFDKSANKKIKETKNKIKKLEASLKLKSKIQLMKKSASKNGRRSSVPSKSSNAKTKTTLNKKQKQKGSASQKTKTTNAKKSNKRVSKRNNQKNQFAMVGAMAKKFAKKFDAFVRTQFARDEDGVIQKVFDRSYARMPMPTISDRERLELRTTRWLAHQSRTLIIRALACSRIVSTCRLLSRARIVISSTSNDIRRSAIVKIMKSDIHLQHERQTRIDRMEFVQNLYTRASWARGCEPLLSRLRSRSKLHAVEHRQMKSVLTSITKSEFEALRPGMEREKDKKAKIQEQLKANLKWLHETGEWTRHIRHCVKVPSEETILGGVLVVYGENAKKLRFKSKDNEAMALLVQIFPNVDVKELHDLLLDPDCPIFLLYDCRELHNPVLQGISIASVSVAANPRPGAPVRSHHANLMQTFNQFKDATRSSAGLLRRRRVATDSFEFNLKTAQEVYYAMCNPLYTPAIVSAVGPSRNMTSGKMFGGMKKEYQTNSSTGVYVPSALTPHRMLAMASKRYSPLINILGGEKAAGKFPTACTVRSDAIQKTWGTRGLYVSFLCSREGRKGVGRRMVVALELWALRTGCTYLFAQSSLYDSILIPDEEAEEENMLEEKGRKKGALGFWGRVGFSLSTWERFIEMASKDIQPLKGDALPVVKSLLTTAKQQANSKIPKFDAHDGRRTWPMWKFQKGDIVIVRDSESLSSNSRQIDFSKAVLSPAIVCGRVDYEADRNYRVALLDGSGGHLKSSELDIFPYDERLMLSGGVLDTKLSKSDKDIFNSVTEFLQRLSPGYDGEHTKLVKGSAATNKLLWELHADDDHVHEGAACVLNGGTSPCCGEKTCYLLSLMHPRYYSAALKDLKNEIKQKNPIPTKSDHCLSPFAIKINPISDASDTPQKALEVQNVISAIKATPANRTTSRLLAVDAVLADLPTTAPRTTVMSPTTDLKPASRLLNSTVRSEKVKQHRVSFLEPEAIANHNSPTRQGLISEDDLSPPKRARHQDNALAETSPLPIKTAAKSKPKAKAKTKSPKKSITSAATESVKEISNEDIAVEVNHSETHNLEEKEVVKTEEIQEEESNSPMVIESRRRLTGSSKSKSKPSRPTSKTSVNKKPTHAQDDANPYGRSYSRRKINPDSKIYFDTDNLPFR